MKTIKRTHTFFVLNVLLTAFVQAQPSPAGSEAAPYRVTRTFHVGGEGGWDYLTVDPEHQLLYVPRSTHTMVLEAQTGKIVADIPGQSRNHGVALVPSVGRGFISDGADASVTMFDLKSYAVLGKIKAAEDADGIIYDSASGKVLVVCGDAGVVIPISPDQDPASAKAESAIELGGKPEFLAADGQGRVFINLVDKNQVAVLDTKATKVLNKWPTSPGGAPVGMSMDPGRRRLFIGCRRPQKLIVMNADNGKVLADLPIGAGVDATKFDGDIFASCGDGTLTVARENAGEKYEVIQTLKTTRGARTLGVDPTTHTLFLPAAELEPQQGQSRPRPTPGSFMIRVVSRAGK